jgi:hypothetical protein
MKYINDMVNKLVNEIECPADIPVSYEVWAIGYDSENEATNAELQLAAFDDPDLAVKFAESVSLAEIVHLAAEYDCDVQEDDVSYISVEIEAVVPDEDEFSMNIGTVYKKVIEIF